MSLVRQYLCFELEWDARLVLLASEVPRSAARPLRSAGLDDVVELAGRGARCRRLESGSGADLCECAGSGWLEHRCGDASRRHRLEEENAVGEISRVALFGKLNTVAYKAIEGATVFCKLRGNPYVELEHWVAQIVQTQDSDWHRIIKHYGLDISVLAKDITAALDRLPRGATSISDLSDHITNAVERGWVYGSLMFGDRSVRTGYVLLGIAQDLLFAQCPVRDFAPVREGEARRPLRRAAEHRRRLARRQSRLDRRLIGRRAPSREKRAARWRRRSSASRRR